MKIDPIFANLMGGAVLKTINNNSLKTFILDLKSKDKGRTVSNYGGWQSNNLSLQENVLKDLIIEIEKNLVSFKEPLALRKEFKLTVLNLWANVNEKGAVNIPHLHPGSVLSGVYYVTFPDNSGRLRLMHPNPNHFSIFSFLGGLEKLVEKPTVFTMENVEFVTKPGALVIFPSHLYHYVLPNLSDDARISFSFNVTMKKEIKKI